MKSVARRFRSGRIFVFHKNCERMKQRVFGETKLRMQRASNEEGLGSAAYDLPVWHAKRGVDPIPHAIARDTRCTAIDLRAC